ncbi:MAG: hypothetical protein LBQ22_05565 [Bacteroidales bacterium]|jgi:hypothetical protein|nr:hypothetical protein [Bacteroidales bacterium]
MNTLFDIPPIDKKESLPYPRKHCRDCKHIANLNPYSNRYWYCTIKKNNRTPYGVKAVKRMDNACMSFENK